MFASPAPICMAAPSGVSESKVQVVSQEQVGPYDTAVIRSDDPDALRRWLRDNGYVLPTKLDPLLAPYVAGKYYFVALKLQQDRAAGDLQPITLRYRATKPGIPIRLTGVAATPDMDVFVWVLGDDRAIPENYRHAVINEARIDWLTNGSNYTQVVTRAVDEAGGQAFVTNYAGPSDVVPSERFTRAHYKLDTLAKMQPSWGGDIATRTARQKAEWQAAQAAAASPPATADTGDTSAQENAATPPPTSAATAVAPPSEAPENVQQPPRGTMNE